MRLCLKMRFSTSFDITWPTEAAIYTKNLIFSHYIICYFKWITQGRCKSKIGKVKLWQNWQGESDEKCHYASDIYFWMVPWLICCFIVILYCILFIIFIMSSYYLPLNPRLSEKSQCFSTIYGSIKMLKYSWISNTFN